MVEILVSVLVMSLLTAIGGYIYLGHLEAVRHETLVKKVKDVEFEVEVEINHIRSGGASFTPSADSGEAMTAEITCDEYVRSLAKKYSYLRNPYDGSPMVTLWDGWRTFQKRGKVRITCYKVHKGTTVSGSHCPLSKAGIRVDTYYTDCGASCDSEHCTIPGKDCSTINKQGKNEFEQNETNELYGAVLAELAPGFLDWPGMTRDCGSSPNWQITHPKEPDY